MRETSEIMCSSISVPPFFSDLCRLCLSKPREDENKCTREGTGRFQGDCFEKRIREKIMTCLSIMVGDSFG